MAPDVRSSNFAFRNVKFPRDLGADADPLFDHRRLTQRNVWCRACGKHTEDLLVNN
jgi:hypothetical protein